jgi:hypothetical protein
VVVVVVLVFCVGFVLVTVFEEPFGFVVVVVFSLVTGVSVLVFAGAGVVAVCALRPKVIRAAANTRAMFFKLFIFLFFSMIGNIPYIAIIVPKTFYAHLFNVR